MAGRKVFTSGEILTSADVNSFLMDQSVMVFADSTARSSAIPSPSEGMVTYLKDEDEVTVFDGSAFKAVGPGKILQVVSGNKSNAFSASISSGNFVDTGLEATITPSAVNSKIVVLGSFSGTAQSTNPSMISGRVTRNGSAIAVGDASGSRVRVLSNNQGTGINLSQISISFEDSPGSTSPQTYKFQLGGGYNKGGTFGIFLNRGESDSDNNQNNRGFSSLMLLEVAV